MQDPNTVNKTALVTGASAGLGEIFCRILAAKKIDLVIVARRIDRLEELAKELKSTFGVKVYPIEADLGQIGAAQKLWKEIGAYQLAIEILVNNAGFGSNGKFSELPLERESQMIRLNCLTLMELTHLALPKMLERKSGHILNIGSTAGFQPGPKMATYYASKAFVNSFSEALAQELEGTGVTLTLSCPGYTETEFGTSSGVNKSSLARINPADAKAVAEQAIEAMFKGQRRIVHGLLNQIVAASAGWVPNSLLLPIVQKLNSGN